MATAHGIVAGLRGARLTLESVGGHLRVSPRALLTQGHRATLRALGGLILEYLEAEAAGELLVYHDGDCPALDGGECGCSPTIAPRPPAEDAALEAPHE